jgi:glycosidase
MKAKLLTFLIFLMQLGCTKHGSPAAPPVNPIPPVTPPATEQYGAPYAAVPGAQDAVVYQVNIRAFSSDHNFNGVKNRLDSIRALGVNVVYLLPIYPVGTLRSVNSPYCVKDYKSVNTEFGTLSDLRALVTAAHDKGMAVILDWVANHTSWDNPWIANKSWYAQDASGNIISPPNTGWNDVAQLNYQQADMRKEMIADMKYWVYMANIDGYRCDAADFVPADFWKQAIDTLRSITTHKLLLLAEGTRSDHFAAGFDLAYGMAFYSNLATNIYAHNGSAQTIDNINTTEYSSSLGRGQVLRYTSNHDVDNSDGTPLELLGGKPGSVAAFIVAAYMKGTPMIYNGQEVGCPVRLTYFNNSTSIDWTLNPDLLSTYKKIIAYRINTEAIRKGTLTSYSSNDVCVFTKELNGKKVLVLVNLRNAIVDYTVPAALVNTNWKDVFAGSGTVTIAAHVSLQPYEYRILETP